MNKYDLVKRKWVTTADTERTQTRRNISVRRWNVYQLVGVHPIHVQRLRITIRGLIKGIGRTAWGGFIVSKFTLGFKREQQT